MDDIIDFFDFSKDFERVEVPCGYISGNPKVLATDTHSNNIPKREEADSGTAYSNDVIRKEQLNLEQFALPQKVERVTKMDQCDDDFEQPYVASNAHTTQLDEDLYENYNFDIERDKSLPIYAMRDEILAAIDSNPVTILEGSTGCGKTTQVPQYILDKAYLNREYCKIVCTQPRRIAAISIARRVSEERNWPTGTVCGYQIGLDSHTHEDTRILYCTTGVLLQKLIQEKTLTGYTHIILDEVHERDKDMDFLLIVVRRLLTTNSQNVKIILMSATINTKEFSDYFTMGRRPAPILCINSRPMYAVTEYYLSDMERIQANKIDVCYNNPCISDEMIYATLKLLFVFDNIDRQETADEQLSDKSNNDGGSILIFLPGIHEIDTFAEKMDPGYLKVPGHVKLFPIRLHSMVASEEQAKVFMRAPTGFRKVILATNIAESSITVPDVKYVIDFCLTKVLINDSSSNFSSLQLQWASRANCRQRAGRAGRVRNGRVYRMVPKNFYYSLPEYSVPEMLRCPIETVVLKSKLLEMGPPPGILGLAMDPPNLIDIRNTILQLKEVGALYTTVDGVYTEDDGDISYWGRIMDALPLDIRLSRLIILGHIFSILNVCVIIAAGLSVRSIFYSFESKTKDKRRNSVSDSYLQKLIFADGSGSDLVAIWRAYSLYLMMCRHQHVGDSNLQWCNRYNINLRSMKEMHLLVQELNIRLERMNIKESQAPTRVRWTENELSIVLKIVIAGAFYPNYFLRGNNKSLDFERNIYHKLSGRDPHNTVFFTNFQPRSMGELYVNQIKSLFKVMHIPQESIEVTFQPGTEKVFVTFKNDYDNDDEENNMQSLENKYVNVPGNVHIGVFKAVRMRLERTSSTIHILEPHVAIRYVQQEKIGCFRDTVWYPTENVNNIELMVLPTVFDKSLTGLITHVISCSKFFFQPISERQNLNQIRAVLNEPNYVRNNRFQRASHVKQGMMVAALRQGIYQRAIVTKVEINDRKATSFKVHFIDFGNLDMCTLDQLRSIHSFNKSLQQMPPRLLECRLAFVQPSAVSSPCSGMWDKNATNMLLEIAQKGILQLDIYSLVNNVANVTIRIPEGLFHEKLVAHSMARLTDEDYMSKYDHDYRLRKQSSPIRFGNEDIIKQNEEYFRSNQVPRECQVKAPNPKFCSKSIVLRGPFSPLESSIHSMLRVGIWKSATIERDSVNSVLLESDPQDSHDRLIVAAAVTETNNSGTLSSRATTLMPNIHGFAAFMIMLFCPTMQLKCNKSRSKYVSILAGLGYNKDTCESLYKEHDLVLNLDVDILKDDIQIINQIRYLMDAMFHTPNDDERPSVAPTDHDVIAATIKKEIMHLLNKPRRFIETHVTLSDYKWENQDELEGLEDVFGTRTLFPMICSQTLKNENHQTLIKLNEHCAELYKMRQFENFSESTECHLCNVKLDSIIQLRIHLLSQLHRDREWQIGFKQN